MRRSSHSIPTGPGSRGGTLPRRWSSATPEQRAAKLAYDRAWRAAHPEYREREALRLARSRAAARGEDPALVTTSTDATRLTPAVFCRCGCGCRAEVMAALPLSGPVMRTTSSISMADEDWQRLRMLARVEGITVSKFVRRMIGAADPAAQLPGRRVRGPDGRWVSSRCGFCRDGLHADG